MKVSYQWLQSFFDTDALPGVEEVEQKLTFHAFEIEGVEAVGEDSVIDVDVLPNRAADSLSHRGIAREVSTLFELPMRRDPLRDAAELEPKTESATVTLSGKDSCSYYVAAVIKGVEVKESPEWLKKALETIGQKSINNVVDATNYVLFDLGRPTHVFDAAKFEGDVPGVGTRLAKSGEKIILLGGDEMELTESTTVIIDTNSDTPVAIGGIKGGAHAEVDENTTDVLIEVANFHPTQTRLTSQALKLRTDASARFENNMADELADHGAVAVAELILKVAGGELVGYQSSGSLKTGNEEVRVTQSRVSKLLGAEISKEEIENILTRLQFAYTHEDEEFIVTAPFERRDIKLPEDVIEEIGRVYGYGKIESAQLDVPEKAPAVHKKFAYAELIRETLTEHGLTEVYLYSLRDKGEVKLLNSLASDKDHLRDDLSSGIIDALNKNERRLPLIGVYDVAKIFEIGNIFLKESEKTHVCVGVRAIGTKKKEARTSEALEEIKSILENTLAVVLPGITGETLEFNLEEVIQSLPELEAYPKVNDVQEGIIYSASSQYPFILRDIALWVPETTEISQIKEMIEQHSGELLKRTDLFDTFEKDGRTSYAFHLVYQSMEETLTDEKIGAVMTAIEAEIASREGWEIR